VFDRGTWGWYYLGASNYYVICVDGEMMEFAGFELIVW